jgi:hypothetical protein
MNQPRPEEISFRAHVANETFVGAINIRARRAPRIHDPENRLY